MTPWPIDADTGAPIRRSGGAPAVAFGVMARAKKTVAKRAAAREAAGRSGDRVVASNRRARRDYLLLETFECGIVLQGSEVKSLRDGKAQLSDAYARVTDGELWLFGVHIPPWQFAAGFGAHDPDRRRKLLLHRHQIDELMGRTQQQALTLVPISLYFKDGKAKVELALAQGRKLYDKRQAIAARDAERESARAARYATHLD
jgi:SsrA-binding protein